MSLTIIARHYWITGHYKQYFSLDEEGEMIRNLDYHQNNNFNFNAFNVDLIYEWRFAPGSVLNIVYKNNISRETSFVRHNFNNNMRDLVNDPQSTTVAIKVLYFLDYIKVHGRLAKGLHKSKTMTSYHQSENQVTKRGY